MYYIFNREIIADEIANRSGKKVSLGRMNWHADSFHIYGKDIQQAKEMLFDRINDMPFENRIFNFHDDFIRQMYEEAETRILEKIKRYYENH